MVLAARRTIGLARFFIAKTGEFVTAMDTVAISRAARRLESYKSHSEVLSTNTIHLPERAQARQTTVRNLKPGMAQAFESHGIAPKSQILIAPKFRVPDQLRCWIIRTYDFLIATEFGLIAHRKNPNFRGE